MLENDAFTRLFFCSRPYFARMSAHLYLHIPFCKQACHYCNFHFSTSLAQKDALLEALLRELELQHDYLGGTPLSSVYFGGGTPSLLSIKELEQIFEKINALHRLLPDAEITLEANPDDLSPDYLADLRRYSPVNRLSIGVQSFHDADLRWMNRAHNAEHARNCIHAALTAGFQDLTLDLIYGAPTTTDAQWEANMNIAFDLGIPHLSCYALTVEEGTALAHRIKKGKSPAVEEERAARQFECLMEASAARGYEQYEVSNYALPGRYARHNSSYWRGAPYLGVGPSAHSFDGKRTRQWNLANNALYIRALAEGHIPFEQEILSPEQRYNELVMTGLRTQWGCDPGQLAALDASFAERFRNDIQRFVAEGLAEQVPGLGAFRVTRAGKLLADGIASALFF